MSLAMQQARQTALATGDFAPLIAQVPYAAFLGMQLALHEGRPRAVLPFRDNLIGNRVLPAVHGGVTAAFMECAAMLHLLYQLDSARLPKSVDFAIDYLLPARTETLHAECEIGRAGSRVAQIGIRCWQSNGDKPVAIARAHFLLMPSE